MAMKTCPCCGAGIAETSTLTRIQQRIYDTIFRHPGLIARELMAFIYADDPDGGPLSPKVISVHVLHINRRLASQGLAIHARHGSSDGYKVIKLEPK